MFSNNILPHISRKICTIMHQQAFVISKSSWDTSTHNGMGLTTAEPSLAQSTIKRMSFHTMDLIVYENLFFFMTWWVTRLIPLPYVKVNRVEQFATSLTATELTCHMGSQCYQPSWQRWHSHLCLSQLKLVLDLATLEGCKAQLT